jgi:hypothetical protein
MNFDPMAKLQEAKGKVADLGTQKAAEAMNQANQLLTLLQDAGYQVGELAVEVGVPPTVTIDLKTGPMVTDGKLAAVFQANRDNDVLSLVLGALIQANKLRDMVKVDTIELKDAKIVLKASPTISLHWKEKATASAAAAS